MKCNICKKDTKPIFDGTLLGKYEVQYYKCTNCDFIQTERPFWLEEAYSKAINDLDVGLVTRNLNDSAFTERVLKYSFNYTGKFLDYAGGYGLFVRLMRDKGFNFFREDRYCDNIFAINFERSDIGKKKKFELVTAFEVLEHLENPLSEIKKIMDYSDNFLFTTELQPKRQLKSVNDWWYFIPETGQHISFYSVKTLKFIANKLGLTFYKEGGYFLFSSKRLNKNPLVVQGENYLPLASLLYSDLEIAKRSLNNVKNTENKSSKVQKKTLRDSLNLALARIEVEQEESQKIKSELVETKKSLNIKNDELKKLRTKVENSEVELETLMTNLNNIYSSRAWRLAVKVRALITKILPPNSNRRKAALVLVWFARRIIRATRVIKSNVYLPEIIMYRIKPKRKRSINKNSKKIVYIGHSYHVKTQSTAFLINYLKKFYDVEVIEDESWKGEGASYPDLSSIDESYLGVIFFQNLPADRNILKTINNQNLIFFPMYDATSTWGYADWRVLREFKIMNFSSTLHKKLTRWGFESNYVQYFPEPQNFIKGKKNEAFFWQRLTFININTISNLFGKEKIKLHIHKAIDPAQQFIQPTKEQEKQYQITYSEWFDKREEMWDMIKDKAIYIAPREYEGIGMSFLEAMALGKAVVAVDNPTMNEYIKDGKNGYLYNLSKPKEIDFSKIEDVQKQTHAYMAEGYKKWEIDKKRIIDFIERR